MEGIFVAVIGKYVFDGQQVTIVFKGQGPHNEHDWTGTFPREFTRVSADTLRRKGEQDISEAVQKMVDAANQGLGKIVNVAEISKMDSVQQFFPYAISKSY